MKKVLAGLACLMVMGCMSPYVDARREAGQREIVGQSTPDLIAVCYNPMWDDQDSANVLAEAECQKQGKKPVYMDAKYFNCSLSRPNTAFFKCQK